MNLSEIRNTESNIDSMQSGVNHREKSVLYSEKIKEYKNKG